jgi:hypothetical protein
VNRLSSLVLLSLIPAALQAQRRCADTLSGASWRQTPLVTQLEPTGERDRDRYVDALLRRMAEGYRDPHADLVGGMAMIPPVEQRDPVTATVRVMLDRRGEVVGVDLTRRTGKRLLDSAIVQAARSPTGRRGYGRIPRRVVGDTVTFDISITDRAAAGSRSVPLGSYSTSYLAAETMPRLVSMPPARAPRPGRRGVAREVVLAGTVGPAGRMIPSSIRVVRATDSTLVPIARRSLERARYTPGTLNGCPAESYINQTFRFP